MLKPKDIVSQTGWSMYRVLRLIEQGKIPAVNTGTGTRPRWEVRQCDLDAFLTPGANPAVLAKKRTIKKAVVLTPAEQAIKERFLAAIQP